MRVVRPFRASVCERESPRPASIFFVFVSLRTIVPHYLLPTLCQEDLCSERKKLHTHSQSQAWVDYFRAVKYANVHCCIYRQFRPHHQPGHLNATDTTKEEQQQQNR